MGATPVPAPVKTGGLTLQQLQGQQGSISDGIWNQNLGDLAAKQYQGAGQKIINSVQQAGDKLAQNDGSLGGTLKATGGVLEGLLGSAAGAVQGVFAPVTAVLQKVLSNSGGNPSITAPTAPSPLQLQIDAIKAWAAQHPEAATNLMDAVTVGGAALGGEAGILGKTAAEMSVGQGVSALKTGATEVTGAGLNAAKATALGVKDAVVSPIGTAQKVGAAVRPNWMVSSAPTSVETVLRETPTASFDKYIQLAQEARVNNKNMTPLEYAGTRAQEALDQIQRKLSSIGSNKSAVMTSAAGRTPVGNIVVKFRQGLQQTLSGKTAIEGDTKLLHDVNSEASKLGDNPSAQQVDKFIDFVQDRIYTSKRDLTIPVTDGTVASLRGLTGRLNESLKSQLPTSYRTLNQQFSDLVDVRNELNQKLGAEGEKGGALMKRVFSPSDANTKQLFAQVLEETGIDLVNEATLARWTMDTLGDTRQKSMLEQLKLGLDAPTSGTGIVRWLATKGADLVNTPEAQIQKARALTPSKKP